MKLDVDFTLKQGDFCAHMNFKLTQRSSGVFGPSGAGKSTLFRALAGLIRPQTGHIILNDTPLFDAKRKICVPPHKRHIGLVFQDARLFPHWSVEKNLRAGECRQSSTAERPFSLREVAQLLAVENQLDRPVSGLSGGEQQRIALGRALLSNPRLLLMDEPVTGLDAQLKAQILPFLVLVNETFGVPSLFISHDLSDIQQLTDHLLLIRDGKCLHQGTIRQLITRPGLLELLSGAKLLNLLQLRIQRHIPEDGISVLYDPSTASAPPVYTEFLPEFPPETPITIGISPSEISLALHRCEGISMQNQWMGCVEQVVHAPDRSLCIVQTDLGRLMVEIVPRSERQLNLQEGHAIVCLLKTKALQIIGQCSASAKRNQS